MAVEKRLSACVQVEGPITSVYRWDDKIETATEWKCSFKTSKKIYTALEQAIKEQHPYDTPEILAFAVEDGSEEYLKWLEEELRD